MYSQPNFLRCSAIHLAFARMSDSLTVSAWASQLFQPMGGVAASSEVLSGKAGRVTKSIAATGKSVMHAARRISLSGLNESIGRGMLKNWKRSLRGPYRPAAGIAYRRKRIAMKRRGPVQAQSFQMVRSGISLVARESVLRINGVPLFHARVAVRFRQDGRSSNGNAARVAFDQGFLLDHHIELQGVDQQIVRRDGELLKRGSHGLPRSLINVPGIDALRVDFRDGPGEGVFANPFPEFAAAFGGEFFGVVEADNAALGIQNNRGGNDRAEQSATPGFVNAGDARPTQLARRSLETGRAEPAHRVGILARCCGSALGSFLDGGNCA